MGHDSLAIPVHTVQVSAFYMGKYEVTKEEWDAVRAWGPANGYTDLPVGGGKAANHPVHTINWYPMVKWCNARSEKEGLTPCYTVGGAIYKTGNSTPACNWAANGYRLPSEAEWEKAARGGLVGLNFPWGNTISHSQANYYSYWSGGHPSHPYDVSPTEGYHPTYAVGGIPYSAPVGSFAPNGYGLYDMAGNIWEWCWDWYSVSYYSSSPSTDPRGPTFGRVPGAPRRRLGHRPPGRHPLRGPRRRPPEQRPQLHRVPCSPQFSPMKQQAAERRAGRRRSRPAGVKRREKLGSGA